VLIAVSDARHKRKGKPFYERHGTGGKEEYRPRTSTRRGPFPTGRGGGKKGHSTEEKRSRKEEKGGVFPRRWRKERRATCPGKNQNAASEKVELLDASAYQLEKRRKKNLFDPMERKKKTLSPGYQTHHT